MEHRSWKIGELSKRTGVTVRTLHHYDQIGLFSPSRVTEAGHRLYTDIDVAKLHQIISLKQLGLSLEEIKILINNDDYDPIVILNLQRSRLDEQINTVVRLRDRVQEISDLLHSGQPVSSERFMMVMQMMKILQSPHFMPGQAADMRNRFKSARANELEKNIAEGQRLVAEFRKLIEMGKLPNDPLAVELAKRWKKKMDSFTPADDKFIQSAERYYTENPEEAIQYGMDGKLYEYIKQALSLI